MAEHPYKRTRFPCRRRVLRAAEALVVHSQALAGTLARESPSTPLRVIPHGVHAVSITRTQRESRATLDLARLGSAPPRSCASRSASSKPTSA